MGTSTKGSPRASSVHGSTGWTISKGTSHRSRSTTSPIRSATPYPRSTSDGPPAWGLYGFPSLAKGPMPRDRPLVEDNEEEEEHFWKGLARDLLVEGIIVVEFFAAVYLYTGIRPALADVDFAPRQKQN